MAFAVSMIFHKTTDICEPIPTAPCCQAERLLLRCDRLKMIDIQPRKKFPDERNFHYAEMSVCSNDVSDTNGIIEGQLPGGPQRDGERTMKSRINSLVVVVLFLFTTLLADAALADKKSSSDRDGADGREASRNQPARAENRPSAANPAPAASTPKQDTPADSNPSLRAAKGQSRGRSRRQGGGTGSRGSRAIGPFAIGREPAEREKAVARNDSVRRFKEVIPRFSPAVATSRAKMPNACIMGPRGPSFTVPKTNHVAVEKPAESKPAETMVSEAESGGRPPRSRQARFAGLAGPDNRQLPARPGPGATY